MKHTSILTAATAALSRPALLGTAVMDRWRSSAERAQKGGWILSHPRTSLAILQLFTSRPLRPLLRTEPRLMFKFLGDYLATDLLPVERAAMLMHHYSFLKDRACSTFFDRVIDRKLELAQIEAAGKVHRIRLSLPRTPYSEGDLKLTFEVDDLELYTLSFTIGPGAIAGLDETDVIYIARVQGKGKAFDRIRQATKDCYDVSPASLLLAAAEGVAQALGLTDMVGIGAGTQVAPRDGSSLGQLVKAYDGFWQSAGGALVARDMYHLELPSSGKPILAVKRDHRSRALRKRRFKKAVRDDIAKAFADAALCGGEVAER